MKLSNLLKILVIGVVSITLPMVQAYAVVPDVHSVLSETVESTSSDSATSGSQQAGSESSNVATDIPAGDLAQPSAVIPADVFEQTSAPEELETLGDDQDEIATALLPEQGHGFWTKRKILTTSLLLGLLLLLAGGGSALSFLGGGGGSSSSGSFAGGGRGGENGDIPPHHPEPSTFLLLGLGLLVPFFRKRSA